MLAVLEYLVYPLIALMFVAVFTREVIAPASRNHCDRRWLFYSSALGALTLVCTLALGYVLESRIRQQALLDVGARWNPLLVGLLSFFITSFVFYWWHRATHASDLLWRMFHQLHHSARRIEVLTSFYDHHAQNYGLPLWDMLFGTWTNPAERARKLGFDDDKSERIAEMLLWRDVHLSDTICHRKGRNSSI